MSRQSTSYCILCDKEATCFGGHVHIEDDHVIAGFCFAHIHTPTTHPECKGCFGKWDKSMGLKPFFDFGYIDADGYHSEEGVV